MGNSYKKPVPKTPLPPKGKLDNYRQLRAINLDPDLKFAEFKIIMEMIIATSQDLFCENTIPKLAKKTKRSERQVQRAIKSLVKKDYLIVEEIPNKGSIYILGNKLRYEMPTLEERELREQELIEEEETKKWKLAFESMCELCPEGRQTWGRMATEELQHEIRVLMLDDAEYRWGVFQEGDRTYVERVLLQNVYRNPNTVQTAEYQGVTQLQTQCEHVNKYENDAKRDVFTAHQGFTSARGDIHVTTGMTSMSPQI